MALTVETGAGVTGADSYNTVADISTYGVDNALDATSWVAGTTVQKEAWAREAATVLDGRWGSAFPGYQASSTQGLLWPRTDAVDREGWALSSDVIPAQILAAHAHLAILAASTTLAPDQASSASVIEVRGASGAGVKFGSALGYEQFRGVGIILASLLQSVGKGRRA